MSDNQTQETKEQIRAYLWSLGYVFVSEKQLEEMSRGSLKLGEAMRALEGGPKMIARHLLEMMAHDESTGEQTSAEEVAFIIARAPHSVIADGVRRTLTSQEWIKEVQEAEKELRDSRSTSSQFKHSVRPTDDTKVATSSQTPEANSAENIDNAEAPE